MPLRSRGLRNRAAKHPIKHLRVDRGIRLINRALRDHAARGLDDPVAVPDVGIRKVNFAARAFGH